MSYRKQPLITVFIPALTVFLVAAIVPVLFMLVQFVIHLVKNPSLAGSMLLDSRQLILLGRSLSIAGSATLFALLVGVPTAFLLSARDLPFRRLFYLLVLVPLFVPSYIMAGAWIHLLAPSGFINRMLISLFGSSAKLSIFSQTGCAWCLGISYFPIIAIIVATGLSKIDRNLDDIARLSTGNWGRFWHSTLPQILPHLIASVCLVMIFALGRYGVPSLLGVNTYPVEIFANFSAFYDDNAAIATALPLMALVTVLILLQRRLMLNRSYTSLTPSSESDNPICLGRFRFYAAVLLLALLIVTTVLPFVSVALCIKGFSKLFSALIQYRSSIITTSIMALITAIVSTAIGLVVGFHLAYSQSQLTKLLDIICWLPIAIPGTIIGLGLVKAGGLLPSIRNSDSFGFFLLLAYIGMFSAFSIRIFQIAYKQADPNIYDLASIECRRWYQRLFYIDLPIHAGVVAASIMIVFVLTSGELNATVLLIPPGAETLAVTIDNLLHYGANVQASALCLFEAVLVILIASVCMYFWSRTAGQRI
ncbi:MAG: ABC transporter permease [Planctomycetota bacterium]|jgi:iron(III) transport system permease protein